MNRHFSEPGWPAVGARGAEEGVGGVRARRLLGDGPAQGASPRRRDRELLGRRRAGRPGHAASDVEQVWTSDNTEAFDRLRIQEGFTMAYTPKVMMAWVTDVPNMNGRVTPLRYRFLTAMQGSLGIGVNLSHWSEADNKLAAEMIAYYKRVRPSVQEGLLYRLRLARRGRRGGQRVRRTRRATGRRLRVPALAAVPARPADRPAARPRPGGRLPHRAARRPTGRQAADPLRGGPDGARPHVRPEGRLRRDLGPARAHRVARHRRQRVAWLSAPGASARRFPGARMAPASAVPDREAFRRSRGPL